MIELANADVICSARQLGDVIGVSSRQIERLTVDGVLKTVRSSSKARGRRYRLDAAVQAFVRHERDCLREKLSRNGNGEYEDARARRMAATAAIEEARAKQITGQLLDRKAATISVVNMVTAIKNHVLALPSRLCRVLARETDVNTVHSILKSHCRGALQEAVDFVQECIEKEQKSRGAVRESNGERETHDS